MEGASILAGRSFLKLGGGLARIYSQSGEIKKYLLKNPELMFPDFSSHEEAEEVFLKDIRSTPKEKVVLIGVGLGQKPSRAFWEELLRIGHIHLVLDGSVLKMLRPHADLFKKHKNQSIIMTPHLGEAGSLLSNEKIENIRLAARELSEMYRAVVYMKGFGGLITIPEYLKKSSYREIYVNSHQNQLAVGGTGDILSGVISSMLYRYKDPIKAIEKAINIYLLTAEKVIRKFAGKNSKRPVPAKVKKALGLNSKKNKDFLTPSDMLDVFNDLTG